MVLHHSVSVASEGTASTSFTPERREMTIEKHGDGFRIPVCVQDEEFHLAQEYPSEVRN